MSAIASSALVARVAPAASGKKMSARSSSFSAAMPKAAKRVNASVKSRGAMRVVAEVDAMWQRLADATSGRVSPRSAPD